MNRRRGTRPDPGRDDVGHWTGEWMTLADPPQRERFSPARGQRGSVNRVVWTGDR